MANTLVTVEEREFLLYYGKLAFDSQTYTTPNSTLQLDTYQVALQLTMDMITRVYTLPDPRPSDKQVVDNINAFVFDAVPIPAWLVIAAIDVTYNVGGV